MPASVTDKKPGLRRQQHSKAPSARGGARAEASRPLAFARGLAQLSPALQCQPAGSAGSMWRVPSASLSLSNPLAGVQEGAATLAAGP